MFYLFTVAYVCLVKKTSNLYMASLWLTKTGLSCPVNKTSNLWLTKTEVVLTGGEDLELLAGLVHALLQAGGQGPGQGQQGRPMVAMFLELLTITIRFS